MANQNDPNQQLVISAPWDSKIVVSAGPGTGKTYTAALRVASIVEQVHQLPDYKDPSIVCLTYTNAASYVTNERLLQQNVLSGVTVSTIDSWCANLSRQFGLSQDFETSNYDKKILELVEFIQGSSNLDFLSEIDHIVVDEAQDIFGPRRKLFDLLMTQKLIKGWTIFGDPAQTIYEYESDGDELSFIEYVIKSELFDTKLELLFDHRSKSKAARSIRAHGSELRKENPSPSGIEEIWREYLDIQVITCSELVDIAPSYNDSGQAIGILVRTNRQLLELSEMFTKKSVEHNFPIENSTLILPQWIADLDPVRDIEELLDVAPSYVDSNDLERLFNRWCQGGKTKRISMENVSNDLRHNKLPLLLKAKNPEIVSLSTIHRSKGLEYEKVLVGMERDAREDSQLQKQEGRLLFVALTRSQNSVVRLNVEALRTSSTHNKHLSRWVDVKFFGKTRRPVGLEVHMKDFVFIRQPDNLNIGDQVRIEIIRNLEDNVGVFGAFESGNTEPFAYLSQDFSSAVQSVFSDTVLSEFSGIYVKSFVTILVPKVGGNRWKQKYFAKVPFMAGMVQPMPKG